MPEEDHFLFKRSLSAYQIVEPMGLPSRIMLGWKLGARMISIEFYLIHCWLFGVEQFLDCRLVPLFDTHLYFFTGRAKPRATHEMRHKGYVFFIRHCCSSFSF